MASYAMPQLDVMRKALYSFVIEIFADLNVVIDDSDNPFIPQVTYQSAYAHSCSAYDNSNLIMSLPRSLVQPFAIFDSVWQVESA